MIKELIKFITVTLAGSDSDQFPVQQVSFMENTADAFIIFPYGMSANAAKDALGVCFSVNGDDQNLAALVTSAKERIKNLEEGEVIFFHPKTKSFTYYKNNGDIDIETKSKVNVVAVQTNLGAGGQPIARLGDSVQVTIPANTFGTHAPVIVSGTIISAGTNTSI